MSDLLPTGWRVTNSTGSRAGPSRPLEEDIENLDVNDSEEGQDGLDIRPDSPGWEDLEDDSEQLSIKDFFSDQVFPNAMAMLAHCKSQHSFDFLGTCKSLGLDFYATIKLVNYIRGQAQQGNSKPDVSDPALWADDKYMQPVLEDDALLFCLDEIVGFADENQQPVDFDERAALEAAKQQRTDLEAVEE